MSFKNVKFQTELPQDVDIDLDEILDIEDENQRKKFIHVSISASSYQSFNFSSQGILNNSKSSKEIINVSHKIRFIRKHLIDLSSVSAGN